MTKEQKIIRAKVETPLNRLSELLSWNRMSDRCSRAAA
jgi:hypothetical protein